MPRIHTAVSGWSARVGAAAARHRHSHHVFRVTAETLAVGGAACVAVGVAWAASTGSAPATPAQVGIVAGWVIAGVLAGIAASGYAAAAHTARFAAEGYAVRALGTEHPAVTAVAVRGALRSLARFDAWAATCDIPRPRAPGHGVVPAARGAWSPAAPRPLLPGESAATWLRRALVLVFAALGVTVVAAMMMRAGAVRPAQLLFATALGLAVAAGVVWLIAARRSSAEYAAGYTTIVAHTGGRVIDVRTAVELVDPRTGVVLRPAGMPSLTTAAYTRRRAAARERFGNAYRR